MAPTTLFGFYEEVIGIVSYSTSDCLEEGAAVFMNIASFRDWIGETCKTSPHSVVSTEVTGCGVSSGVGWFQERIVVTRMLLLLLWCLLCLFRNHHRHHHSSGGDVRLFIRLLLSVPCMTA